MSNLTLVVASYNHEELIPRALESVAAQTERPRLIVTDDASKDHSQKVIVRELNRLGLAAETIFHTENAGICKTFNEALALVETPLVAFISADDWMEPSRVEEHAHMLMQASGSVGLLYGDMIIDYADGSLSHPLVEIGWSQSLGAEGDVYHEVLREHFFPTPTVVMRTEAAKSVGGYDESLAIEDFDMWMRMSQHFDVVYHPTPLVHYWQHSKNFSGKFTGTSQLYLRDHLRAGLKHLGSDPVAREIMTPKLYMDSILLWKHGERPQSLAPHIWREAIRSRSIAKALQCVAAALNLPASVLFPARPPRG